MRKGGVCPSLALIHPHIAMLMTYSQTGEASLSASVRAILTLPDIVHTALPWPPPSPLAPPRRHIMIHIHPPNFAHKIQLLLIDCHSCHVRPIHCAPPPRLQSSASPHPSASPRAAACPPSTLPPCPAPSQPCPAPLQPPSPTTVAALRRHCPMHTCPIRCPCPALCTILVRLTHGDRPSRSCVRWRRSGRRLAGPLLSTSAFCTMLADETRIVTPTLILSTNPGGLRAAGSRLRPAGCCGCTRLTNAQPDGTRVIPRLVSWNTGDRPLCVG